MAQSFSTDAATSVLMKPVAYESYSMKPYYGKKAVVVGAGPAGACAAMFLAEQGFTVEVFERRAEPRADAVDTGRAYIIILIPRGQAAIKALNIPLPTDPHSLSLGTVSHNYKGKVRVSKEEGNVTFSRSGLAQWLIDEARSRYPGRIKFTFNAPCESVDLAGKKVAFGGLAGSDQQQQPPAEVSYDLLVGADGVASQVRAAVAAASQGYEVQVSDSGREYKVYGGLRGDIEPPEFKGRVGSTLHLFTTNDPFTTLTAHNNPDGTYSGTFSLATGGFDALHSLADYEALIKERFVGVPPEWIPQVAAQVAEATPNPAGKRIKVTSLGGPSVVLLGDAAHAVTPVFGQGANSALESCLTLSRVLAEAQGDLDSVPQRFNAERVEDVHSLYELDRKAYSFFRRKGPLDPDFLQLLAHVVLGTLLSKVVPFLYGAKPALLRLGSGIRYSEIISAVRRDALIALAGFVALVVFTLAKALALV